MAVHTYPFVPFLSFFVYLPGWLFTKKEITINSARKRSEQLLPKKNFFKERKSCLTTDIHSVPCYGFKSVLIQL